MQNHITLDGRLIHIILDGELKLNQQRTAVLTTHYHQLSFDGTKNGTFTAGLRSFAILNGTCRALTTRALTARNP